MEQIEGGRLSAPDSRARNEDEAAAARGGWLAAVDWTRLAYLAAGALVIGVVMAWLQFSTRAVCCGDFDGYYHVRWSQLLWEGMRHKQFPPAFTWLPLTTLNARDYVDHHLLFHVLQIPFTTFGDIRLGAKISAWLFATLAVFSCYWLLVRYRIRYPLVWLFALLGCSAPFVFRMSMTKAMSFSIVLLITGIALLFARRYLWLLPLAFIFTLTYDMFALLGLAAFVWTLVILWHERRIEWRPLVWTSIGIAAGFVINPYFPHNLQLFSEHLLMKVSMSDDAPKVGNEWYPYDSWDFLKNCVVAFVAMAVGYVAFRAEVDRKRAAQAAFFLVFATVLLIANAKWRRFSEYWPPFAVLFAAFSLRPLLEDWLRPSAAAAANQLPPDVADELQPFFDAHEDPFARADERRRRERGLVAACIAGVALCISMVFTVRAETHEIKDSAAPEDYRAGIEWMRVHVPAGQVIFNTDWDDFPKLFFYDPTHAYVSGLDPTYLYDQNRELSKLYDQITLGQEKNPGPIIRDRFGAHYVFTDNEEVHDNFYDAALDSGWFDEVYSDKTCTILQLRDQQGPPPAADKADDNNGDGSDDAQADDADADNAVTDDEDAANDNNGNGNSSVQTPTANQQP